MPYVFVSSKNASYYKPFSSFGQLTFDPNILTDKPNEVALAVFTGGEDVDPSFYGEKKGNRTCSNLARDVKEKSYFDEIVNAGIPIVGICRGAQFTCVMAGGGLCQHVNGHAGTPHEIKTFEGTDLIVNSYHHQMQFPEMKLDPHEYRLLAWAEPRIAKYFLDENDKKVDLDIEYEMVYYPDVNALAIQHHPESMDEKSDGFKYTVYLTNKLLAKGL